MASTSKYSLSVFSIISYNFGLTCNPIILNFSSSSILSWVCQVAALFRIECIDTVQVLESETLAEAAITAEHFPLFALAIMLMIYIFKVTINSSFLFHCLVAFYNSLATAEAIVFFSEEPCPYPPIF